MKPILTLLVIAALITGCKTKHIGTPLKFNDVAGATVILHFSSEAVVHSIKPAEKTGDFYTLLDWQRGQEIAKAPDYKAMAVVILDAKTDTDLERHYRQKITDSLSQMGYARIILLRGQADSDKAAGLGILMDTSINRANLLPNP